MKKLIVICSLFLSAGAFAQTPDTTKKDISTIRGFTYNGLPPLMIVDGVKYKGDLKSINPNDIESISVLKSSKETSLYGAEGLSGVILITTKKNKGSINLLAKPTVAAKPDTSSTNPMYIIDGKKSTAAGMQGLNPNDIDNISILKDASATSIYGPAGKNGVVIIVTKAYKKEHAAKKAETERQGKN